MVVCKASAPSSHSFHRTRTCSPLLRALHEDCTTTHPCPFAAWVTRFSGVAWSCGARPCREVDNRACRAALLPATFCLPGIPLSRLSRLSQHRNAVDPFTPALQVFTQTSQTVFGTSVSCLCQKPSLMPCQRVICCHCSLPAPSSPNGNPMPVAPAREILPIHAWPMKHEWQRCWQTAAAETVSCTNATGVHVCCLCVCLCVWSAVQCPVSC